MPTYGCLHGDKVVVNMTEANFDGVEPGIRHVMKVTVRNISMRGQRVRLVPPKPKEFTLHVQNDVELAPGLEMQAELAYFAEEPKDVESQLVVLVGRADVNASMGEGERLTIPVRATLPGAKLVCDTTVDYGIVLPNHSRTHRLVVRNEGSAEGKMSIQAPPPGGKLSVLPLEALIAPGDAAAFRCDLKTDHELGPFSVPLGVTIRGSMAFHPLPETVTFRAVIADPVLEVHDGEGRPMQKAELGRVFCGLTKTSRATLVNTGPLPVNFAISKAEEGAEGDDKEVADPLTVYPPMGRVEPMSSVSLEFTFAPPKKPPPPKGFLHDGDNPDDAAEELGTNLNVEVLETGQKVPLRLEGTALAPRLALSQRAFNFGSCAMYEHREATLKLTNKHDAPYAFTFVTPAHYGVSPSSGVVGGGGSVEVELSFKPHQVGQLSGKLQLLGFGGKVASQSISVVGHCAEPAYRRPAGGVDKLPEDFYSAPVPVDQGTVSFPPGPVGPKWQRPPRWEMSETLQGGKIQQGGTAPMAPLTTLAKQKTYEKQMAYQPVLDAIGQMDTGLELPAAAIKAQAEHRAYYNDYLQMSHTRRAEKRRAKHKASSAEDDDFFFGVSLGLDPFSGCAPFLPPVSNATLPLTLDHEYDESFENKAGLSSALFDPFRVGGKKFKPKPDTMDEVAECKATLKPEELKLVTGGPRTLDFGNISVFTQVTRCFTVINELRQSILVALDTADEPELTSPPPQVIPPGGAAGFDLTFSSKHPSPYRRTITYTVNGAHAFKFTAAANVEPIDVGLSTDEAVFRFADGSLDTTITQTVLLTNPGTHPAVYKWEHPAGFAAREGGGGGGGGKGAAAAAVCAGVDDGRGAAQKSVPVEITYTPTAGAPTQHALTAIIEGGPSKTLHCRADVEECRASVNVKKVDFGVIAAGVAREKTFLIKNPGATEAVFTIDEPANKAFTVRPRGRSAPAARRRCRWRCSRCRRAARRPRRSPRTSSSASGAASRSSCRCAPSAASPTSASRRTRSPLAAWSPARRSGGRSRCTTGRSSPRSRTSTYRATPTCSA